MPARADLVGAIIEHTLALPETTALVGKRVSARLRIQSNTDPNGWKMPDYAVVWRKVPGPVGPRTGTTPVVQVPLQYECYGPDLRRADELARTLLGELFPDPPESQSFRSPTNGCVVFDLQEMGAAAPLMETPTDLPRVVGTLFCRYLERPAA